MKRIITLLGLLAVFSPAFAQNDLSVTAITQPVSGCALTSTENVTIRIFNFGNTLITGTSFNVSYTINAGAPVVELVTLASPLLSNSTLNYTFTTQANLSVPGTYTFDASVALAGDINPTNDAFTGYSVVNTPSSVGGSVSGGTDVCVSGNAGVLTLSGETGSVVRWEYSTDGGVTWINISNTTNTQSYSNLTVPTQYRAQVQSGSCATATSSIASMTIDPVSVGGTVNSNATVCSGANAGTLTLTGKTGSVVRWEKSTDGGVTWVNIANTTTSQSYLNLVTTTKYRALVQSGACSSVHSSIATITVSPTTVGGTLNPASTTVCAGSNSGTLTLTGKVGSVVRWEHSNDGGVTWLNIANTTTTLTYTNITQTNLYRVRVQSSPCSVQYSTVDTVNVTTASVGGSLAPASSTVCSGMNHDTLVLSGESGSIVQWEESTDGGTTWTVIANTTNTEIDSNLTMTTMYRALVQSGGCSASYSSTATINVDAVTVGGTVSGGVTVCSGSNGGTMMLNGQSGSILQWEFSNDQLTWNPIANTTTSQNFSNLTDTTYYRVIVQSGVCPADTATQDTVIVDPVSVGGTISPAADTVCSGINSGTLTLVGDTGSVVQWEYSTDNGVTWITISNTTTSQSFNNLTTATIYRALVKSGVCSQTYSAQATVSMNQQATGGTLYSDATVCGGSNNGTLTLVGFNGSVTQWESSIDNGVTWSAIPNTNYTYGYLNLVDTTKFRVIVASGVCPTDTSSIVTISVDPPSVGGTLSMDDTVCAGSNAGTLSLSGQTGSVIGWEYSTDGGVTWVNIANTTTTQNYVNLAQTTMYRVDVGNGVCAPVTSSVATITVDPPVNGGMVTGSTTVCASGNSGSLTLSGSSGTIVTWETSTDGGATWVADGNTTTTENYTNLTDTTWYRAILQSGTCGGDTSTVGVITVDPVPVGGTTSPNALACAGMNNGVIHLTGDTGSVSRWEYSTDGGNNWIALSNTTDSLTYVNLTMTTMYRAVVMSGVCNPPVYSSNDTITVSPMTVPGVVTGSAQVCEGTGSGVLTLTGYTGSILGWETSSDGGMSWSPVPNATPTQAWSNPVDTTWYHVLVTSGACPLDTSTVAVVSIYPKPVAGFTTVPVCFGSPTAFTNTTTISSGGIQFQSWDFGDNGASVASNPVYTYGTSGSFNATLIVVSDNGCSDTATNAVVVNALPSSAITASGSTTLCSGDSVMLSVPSSPQDHYLWTNGSTTDFIYAMAAGTYGVTVTDTVTSCMSMDSAMISVLPRPVASAGPDTSVSAGSSITLLGSGGDFYSWSPTVGLSDPNVANPACTPPYTVTYTLTVTAQNGCTDTDAVAVTFVKDYNIIISNLITANGDGYNDVWNIQNIEFYPNNKVTIYNRNGMVVYEAEGYNNSWNGTYNGQQLPDGT
ncbi:MAG TPA: gliding motility-associated C-terminal domain-containing protein, partial [Bacteroidia bacterium]|nr:gliding motility-associated C-terminal domain-containing protein [Bacteroidia bacterium]